MLIAYHRVRTRYSDYTSCSFFAENRVRTTGSGYTPCMMMAVDCVGTTYKCMVSSRQYQSVLHCRLPQSAFAFYDVPLCVVRIFQGRPLIKQCMSIYSVLLFLVHLVCIHDLSASCCPRYGRVLCLVGGAPLEGPSRGWLGPPPLEGPCMGWLGPPLKGPVGGGRAQRPCRATD